MRIALITGASSGLGREYARWASEEGAYDQIWAVARRRERLEELAEELATPVRAVALDLTEKASISQLKGLLDQEASQSGAHGEKFGVGLLVNAAGLGKFGTYADMTCDEVDTMVDLNCRALVDVTQVALGYMGRGGRIIQIASSASFQPLPGLNVYAASKAFVRSYSRALRFELRGRGIFVTAVCPLWVKTEFIGVARQTANGQTVRHPFPVLGARRVVRWSMLVNSVNYPIATCCVTGLLMRIADKIIPAPLIMWIWEGVRRM
ncbi:SDR family oxidoreductase [Olsenella sp. Marseille-P4559]|jgi:short-subunit dehydrogenase|uniref:SDR family NAD(P)-dependent oxidoreductase n=1 Tax=Olsenella sp. Marseille-P4559 TaxID=2364795 RepID=UPI0010312AB2|nr:SDR family NAD(P)-dependent oxidoreductase [Olsenella sp. Marseille-P4559]